MHLSWRTFYPKTMTGKIIVSSVLLVSKAVWKILVEQDVTFASSLPWTITTEYGEIDEVHRTPHKGIDFAVPQGTPIKAVVEGNVEVVRDEGNISFGKSVRIRTDDGRLTIYAHLSQPKVHVGQHVEFGDVIGNSGNTGNSTGPHLHFQVNINGKPVNPMPTIVQGMAHKLVGGR